MKAGFCGWKNRGENVTNFEKWKDKILELTRENCDIALLDNCVECSERYELKFKPKSEEPELKPCLFNAIIVRYLWVGLPAEKKSSKHGTEGRTNRIVLKCEQLYPL